MIDTAPPKNWVEARLPYAAHLRAHFTAPVWPRDQPYLGTLPVIITATLIFMAASGFVLSLFYNPADPYSALQFIDRDVNSGWLIHAFHETGTTMIFGAVYLFLFRAVLTGSYRAPGELVWLLSIAQFALLLLVGYLGYLLTGGAVSYWSLAGGTGTANALAGLPGALGVWFFGGPNGPGTLARLAVFHIVAALAIFAIIVLHRNASRALAPLTPGRQKIGFHPYYTAQYFAAFAIFTLIFAILVFFAPHLGENPLNRAAANPLLVPAALTPPWYLLGIAGVAATFTGGLAGLLTIIAALAALFALPWLDRARRPTPGFVYRLLVVILALDILVLGIAAAHQPSAIAAILVTLCTIYYFVHFLILTPLVTAMEPK